MRLPHSSRPGARRAPSPSPPEVPPAPGHEEEEREAAAEQRLYWGQSRGPGGRGGWGRRALCGGVPQRSPSRAGGAPAPSVEAPLLRGVARSPPVSSFHAGGQQSPALRVEVAGRCGDGTGGDRRGRGWREWAWDGARKGSRRIRGWGWDGRGVGQDGRGWDGDGIGKGMGMGMETNSSRDEDRDGTRMGTGQGLVWGQGRGWGENETGHDRVGTGLGLGWDRDGDKDQTGNGMGWQRIGKGMETGWGSRLGQGMAWDAQGGRRMGTELGW